MLSFSPKFAGEIIEFLIANFTANDLFWIIQNVRKTASQKKIRIF